MPEAQLTDELVASMRAKVGMELRVEGSTSNEEVTRLAILRFAHGIVWSCWLARCTRFWRRRLY